MVVYCGSPINDHEFYWLGPLDTNCTTGSSQRSARSRSRISSSTFSLTKPRAWANMYSTWAPRRCPSWSCSLGVGSSDVHRKLQPSNFEVTRLRSMSAKICICMREGFNLGIWKDGKAEMLNTVEDMIHVYFNMF